MAGLLVLVLVAAAVLKLFIFELPRVDGNDMAPTLQKGDLVLAYSLNTSPARGELVLMEHPTENKLLIRRVVGLPGERIAVKGEVPLLDGKEAQREEIKQVRLQEGDRQLKMKWIEETIGPTQYAVLKDPGRRSVDTREVKLDNAFYVLSDNRNHGTDSRTFGPVPGTKIRAVVTHLISSGPGTIVGQKDRKDFTRIFP